ncbi:hypothetical protein Tdes44962_MAKER05095 [Teratosphaeria destructans]|uniref:Uncharacterized protein n=1 Tax=Teratosphaeria destructans TaxID=418781 RepID=A0A9W7VZC4_9PEZI|nr:hypothetical protein Tdes44962_MAKER05095 [Teratosphaeria destructans]
MPGPNPAVIPRKRAGLAKRRHNERAAGILMVTVVAAMVIFAATTTWARRWLLSGCALESALLIFGEHNGSRIWPHIPLWPILASFNLLYAIAATSWLLHTCFTFGCYPLIAITCLFQSSLLADFARRRLRAALKHTHFTRDKIALFNLPALEIDTDVDGLFVVRGITISLSNLTIVAHGIELGIKLANDIELSMYADEVHIALFRRIDVGDVFGNVKGLGNVEMTFADLDEDDDGNDDDSIFLGDTPLLRAATAGSEGFKDRPKLRESLTGVSWMRDSSVQAGIGSVKTLSPDDTHAEKQYMEVLTDIRTSSPVYQSRARVRQKGRDEKTPVIEDEKDMRAAICAELHGMPSISHPPERSIRVTTLQNLSKPSVRHLLHRLPLLLRLLLAPLSYFHPIKISSVSVAGSGQWLTALLQDKVFKHYADTNAELRRLTRRVSSWLADANFCLQLEDIDALGQVPLSTDFDIVTYLHFADVMAYRTVASLIAPRDTSAPASGETNGADPDPIPSSPRKLGKRQRLEQTKPIAQVVRLGGADATFTIPSFLLPHHEHILPPKPTFEDEEEQSREVDQADGKPKTVQARQELKKIQRDETNVTMTIHGSLPACFDQSLLNFTAALVKATKIIELEKTAYDIDAEEAALSPDDDASVTSGTHSRNNSGFKAFTKGLRQGMKDGNTRDVIKEFARDVHQATKDNFKKAVVGGVVNDRWIAKMVGRVATKLEMAQGDLGYSGEIPVGLGFYRRKSGDAHLSKLLP